MTQHTTQETYLASVKFRQDYDAYLDDHHLTMDTIVGITCSEARDILRSLRDQCPHNLARVMAMRHPLDAERWDEVEHRVQELLE